MPFESGATRKPGIAPRLAGALGGFLPFAEEGLGKIEGRQRRLLQPTVELEAHFGREVFRKQVEGEPELLGGFVQAASALEGRAPGGGRPGAGASDVGDFHRLAVAFLGKLGPNRARRFPVIEVGREEVGRKGRRRAWLGRERPHAIDQRFRFQADRLKEISHARMEIVDAV